MGAPILMQAFSIPQGWVWGGNTFTLALFSNLHWTDQQGAIHLRGNQSLQDMLNEPAQLCPGAVNGRIATVSDFTMEPTVLSIDESQNVRITGLLFDQNFQYVDWLFKNWIFPSEPNPLTWPALTRYNHLRNSRIGMSAMDVIHGWFTGLVLISPQDLARLPKAAGTAVMVDGIAVVPTAKVTVQSVPNAWSTSQGVTGSLRAPIELANVGANFTVLSSNDLDNGLIGWEIREPF